MERRTLSLRDYADAIVRNPGQHSIVLNLDTRTGHQPHEIMAQVTLLVAQELWGDFKTWNLDNITLGAWHGLKDKMACTEWAPCIATKRTVPGLTFRPSQALEGYWLWQDADAPDGLRLKLVPHIDLMLWCVPDLGSNECPKFYQ